MTSPVIEAAEEQARRFAAALAAMLAGARALVDDKGRVPLGDVYLVPTPDAVFEYELAMERSVADEADAVWRERSALATVRAVRFFAGLSEADARALVRADPPAARDAAFAALLSCAPSEYDEQVRRLSAPSGDAGSVAAPNDGVTDDGVTDDDVDDAGAVPNG